MKAPPKFINNNVLAFEADSFDEKSPLYGRECYVLDYRASEMSGSDCYVAYPFASEAEFQTCCPNWNLANGVPLAGADYLDEKDAIAFVRALPSLLVFITPEEKSRLKPTCTEGAVRLFTESVRDYTSLNTDWGGEPCDPEWLEMQHKPYMYEKLGRATANCADLLGMK